MKTFDLRDIAIKLSVEDGSGDDIIKGSAKLYVDGASSKLTSGGRLTSEERRGGKTIQSEISEVLCKLIRTAADSAK